MYNDIFQSNTSLNILEHFIILSDVKKNQHDTSWL